MERLKVNIFVENDIIGPKEISINISNSLALIASCTVIIFINIKQRGYFI